MSRDLLLLLAGAGIALLSSVVSLILQHLLALRADNVRRRRNALSKEKDELKESLLKGVSELEMRSFQQQLTDGQDPFKLYAPIDTTRYLLWKMSLEKQFAEIGDMILSGDLEGATKRLHKLRRKSDHIRDQLGAGETSPQQSAAGDAGKPRV